MKAALCQLNIIFEGKMVNLINAEKYISEASDAQADIIFFPEMTLNGFSMNVSETGDREKESIKLISSLAGKYRIAIGFGWAAVKGDKGENHYTVISPDGSILADYIKIHPFSYSHEDRYFNAGTELSSFFYKGKKISLFICYDLRFPEIFQAVSKDSDVIVVAANWPEKRIAHWDTLLCARAIENQSWILGVNCFGDQNGLHYCGNSTAAAPDGTVREKLHDREGLIIIDINDEADETRKAFPVKNDRRPDLYKNMI